MAKGITILSSLVVLATGFLGISTAGVQLAETADPGDAAKLLKEAGFPDLPSYKEQGFVLAGQLVGIVEGLNETWKGDVLSTIVTSKLATNDDTDFDFVKNFAYWDLTYGNYLAFYGWSPVSYKFDQHFKPTSDKVTLNEVLEEFLGRIATNKTQITVLTKVLDALKKFPDGDSRLTLFENTAVNGTMIVHLISNSSQTDEIWMTTASITFHTPSKVSHFLSHEWDKAQVQVVGNLKIHRFSDDMFAPRRVKVAQKLKDKGGMSQVIKDINI